ncbi:acyltransferase [Shimwellia blattae]|uniref:Acyltransferase 3 family protein n=1 Tax=Shimwellia blattae (strain ATCC 29907 / DSM 4481 / JCM 1650 / NBRC 105725 / CDC 9005-74) TaxID=630626 RepID=I2B9Q2_SHIBC|nr:acyltransferase family protein [Shimwellia blattae]AFJ47256.1 acyltransferase 3 family protein [Shimwellia blattae DSM 4481 = NBRC 105725]GAB82215.1 hypothetical protein EB105725_21_00125 [Shimwellia blattae DSM 4481 = NBRC 105725]VDY64749.1 Uncharacterized protein conserved in bacteria [Shimwellia blattae]VEC22848.1 Uncharacterized protein conserved in bacteria [Shimwellia blattae]
MSDNISKTILVKNSRNVNIELLRCIAIFCVLFIHLSSPFFYSNELFENHSKYWLVNNIYYASSRFSVPVFFMVTAHLCLNSNGSYDITKRVKKLFIPFLFWSGVYFYYGDYSGSHGLFDYVKAIIFNKTSTHLWFIPAFIGYVILLPLIKTYFIKSNDSGKPIIGVSILVYVTLIPFSATCLTAMGYDSSFIWGSRQYNVSIAEFIVFPITLYFASKVRELPAFLYFLIFIVSVSIVAYLNVYASYNQEKITELFFNYTSPLVIISSICVFKFFMKTNIKSVILSGFINALGGLSFGIYLSHIMVRNILQHYDLISWSNPAISPIINTVVIFTISAAMIFVIKKIPVIRRVA